MPLTISQTRGVNFQKGQLRLQQRCWHKMRVRSSPLLQPLLQLLLAGLEQDLQPASMFRALTRLLCSSFLLGLLAAHWLCGAFTLCQLSAAGACTDDASICCSLCTKQDQDLPAHCTHKAVQGNAGNASSCNPSQSQQMSSAPHANTHKGNVFGKVAAAITACQDVSVLLL